MLQKQCDIWEFTNSGIVIPVNLEGVMGRGLARQVRDRWPVLASRYRQEGKTTALCNSYFGYQSLSPDQTALHFYTPQIAEAIPPSEYYRIVMFPVKRKWKDEADIDMIRLSLRKLINLMTILNLVHFAIPLVGCGFGELHPDVVVPIIHQYLDFLGDRVTLVLPDPSIRAKYPNAFKPGWREDRSIVKANDVTS